MNDPVPASLATLPRESGDFRLLKELGRGGMGVVYEAQEISSGRRVALKVLAAELVVSKEAFERFRREARLAASISDSHCVFVYGAHEIEGSPAIAMELCEGETLEQRLARQEPIPIETAVRWMLEILEGLEAAHRSGVVHRDVKPSNCFITDDGHVKIGDFGLARTLARDVRLTQSGVFLGSPLYASPEQIKGRAIDLRSDIYSCGATLYALLTGQPPYTGENVGEVLARILSEPLPRPRALRREIPRALERVLLCAMKRDPDQRFHDPASFREALQPFSENSRAPGGLGRRFVAYLLDSVATFLLSMLTLMLLQSTRSHVWDVAADWTRMLQSAWLQLSLTGEAMLYYALLEGLLGQTLGKSLLGLRVLPIGGDQPSLGRALVRALVFFMPSFLPLLLPTVLELSQVQHAWISWCGDTLLTLAMFTTARRRNGWRGLHEFASDTRVTRLPSPFARFRQSSPPPEWNIERAGDLPARIGDYSVDGVVGTTPHGTLVQARDPELERSVWIHPRIHGARAPDEARRSLMRSGRLRWLDTVSEGHSTYDVFESPGGASLASCSAQRGGFEWPLAHRCLVGLADELAVMAPPDGVCVEQAWIDRSWNLRLLDEPIGAGPFERWPPLDAMREVARRMLPAGAARRADIPPDLPAHAEPTARRIFGLDAPFEDFAQMRAALGELSTRPLTRRTRAPQLALAIALPVLVVVLGLVIGILMTKWPGESFQAQQYIEHIHNDRASVRQAGHVPLDADGIRARQILIATALDPELESYNKTWMFEPWEREIQLEASRLHPAPTPEEIVWATAKIRAEDPSGEDTLRVDVLSQLPFIPFWITLAWGLLGSLFAFAPRGGLSLTLLGVRIRTRRGELALRWRCLLRSFAVWLPLAVLYGVPALLALKDELTLAYFALGAGLLVHMGVIAHALWSPTRSLADRFAGTRLVPR